VRVCQCSHAPTGREGRGWTKRIASAQRPGLDIGPRAVCFSSRSIFNWTRRTASKGSLASAFPDLARPPIRNCHFQTPGFRPGQRISNAFVIRGEFPACRLSYITGAEPIGSICPIMRFTGRRRGPAPAESVMAALSHGCFKLNPPDARNIQGGFAWIRAPVRARSRDQRLESAAPLKRSMLAWRRRPIPRVMQCPRQK